MNAPDCICSPGRLPLGAFCAGRDDLEREALHDDRISIRAPRAGRDFLRLQDIARALISIHAPRVGRDYCVPKILNQKWKFQSTRPVWGATGSMSNVTETGHLFQSTRPVWGATIINVKLYTAVIFQSTRPVWGATREIRRMVRREKISIHAPRVGRDVRSVLEIVRAGEFQSTRPVWGATMLTGIIVFQKFYFNPRAPCGARQ